MAVLMPITWPAMSTSGPPEFPGLIAASVCRNRWNWPPTLSRSLALIIPAVTVALRPKGLPIATTQSPTLTPSEFPELRHGKVPIRIDLEYGQIGLFIGAYNLGGIVHGVSIELDLNLGSPIHHMVVG